MNVKPIIDFLSRIHALDRVPRSGYLLRGVTEPESVASHSHALAILAELVCLQQPGTYDNAKVLAMALIHDVPEVVTMDIPMPAGTDAFKKAKVDTEGHVMAGLCSDGLADLESIYAEYIEGKTLESRLVKGLDKVQMMVRVNSYQREGRGILEEFWQNPANFADYGIDIVSDLFAEIAAQAGKTLPT